MPLLDFDTLVICNQSYDIKLLKKTTQYFKELGIKNFIVTHNINLASYSLSYIDSTFKEAKAFLKSATPSNCKLCVTPNVPVLEGYMHNTILKRLTFKFSRTKTNRIFLEAPTDIDDWWLMQDLNYLIYKQRLVPVFVSVERNLKSYKIQYFNKFLSTRTAVFCIDINTLISKSFTVILQKCVRKNIPIVPCISPKPHLYKDIIERFAKLREMLGDEQYLKLCKHFNDSKRYLIQLS